MSLGILRIDELLLPIREIHLINGGFRIVAEVRGPQSPCEGRARLFSNLGYPVLDQAAGEGTIIQVPLVRAEDTVIVTYDLFVNHVQPSGKKQTTRYSK